MKKVTFAILALALAFSAHATKPGNNGGGNGGCGAGQTTNGCGGNDSQSPVYNGGTAYGGSGTGIGLAVAVSEGGKAVAEGGDASASVKSSQTQLAVTGGNKQSVKGGDTTVAIGGDVTESNTPPVMPGVLPSVPTSCRLYLFGGGSTRDGAGSGTFPIGNDQTCLSIAALNLMERAGGFTQAEKQAIVCRVEGMSTMETCKSLSFKKSPTAVNTAAPIGFEHANLSDPSIRRRAGLSPLSN